MNPAITPLYAALLGLVFLLLSVRTIRTRRSSRIGLGTGGNPDLERAARVHANFAEYAPLTLLLILFAELCGYPAWLVHVLGAALLVGRVVHAIGFSRADEDFRFRVTSTALTLTTLASSALLNLAHAFR